MLLMKRQRRRHLSQSASDSPASPSEFTRVFFSFFEEAKVSSFPSLFGERKKKKAIEKENASLFFWPFLLSFGSEIFQRASSLSQTRSPESEGDRKGTARERKASATESFQSFSAFFVFGLLLLRSSLSFSLPLSTSPTATMGLQGHVGDASDARKIRALEAKRASDKEALERAKSDAEKGSNSTALREFGAGESEAAEAAFKAGTVGLVTREQFLATRDAAEAAAREAAAEEKKRKRREAMSSSSAAGGGGSGGGGGASAAAAAAAAKRAAARGKLSFGDGEGDGEDDDGDEEDEDEGDDEKEEEEDAERREGDGEGKAAAAAATANNSDIPPPQHQRRRLAKDPTVRTDFLPDADEEARERSLRAALLEEFEEQRERAKAAPLEVVFSYWDGAGHRRQTTVAAGSTIGAFLGKAR